jgi:hypothetical protein
MVSRIEREGHGRAPAHDGISCDCFATRMMQSVVLRGISILLQPLPLALLYISKIDLINTPFSSVLVS